MARQSDWLVMAQSNDSSVKPCKDCNGSGSNCSTCNGFGY